MIENKYEFQIEDKDDASEKFEILAMKMDLHKSGILFVNELSDMLDAIPAPQREPIRNFLTAYYNNTKRSTISLKSFISNILKAYHYGKFNLQSVVQYNESTDNKDLLHIIDKSIPLGSQKPHQNADDPQKAKPKNAPSASNYKGRAMMRQKERAIKAYEQPTQSFILKRHFEKEKRFDQPDYTKPGSFFNKPGLELGFTERIIEKNKIQNIANSNNPIPRCQTSEEKELARCTFKPYMHRKSRFGNVQPRLLDHYKRAESMCEQDIKYLYDKSSIAPEQLGLLNSSRIQLNRSLREPLLTKTLTQSDSKDKLFKQSANKDKQELNRYESVSVRSDYSEFTPNRFSNMSYIDHARIQTPNFFDVKSQKNLNYLLKGGYSCKFHERKHFNATKAVRNENESKIRLINSLNASSIYMANSISEWKNVEGTDKTIQLLYNDLFTERYKNLTKNLVESVNDSKINEKLSVCNGANISQEFKNAKRQRIYKDLNFNINLEGVFGKMGAKDLTNVKKLHVLYASQKAQEKKQK